MCTSFVRTIISVRSQSERTLPLEFYPSNLS